VTNDDAGKQLTVTVTAKFTGAASVSKTSAAVTATGITTTRIAGDDRYATSVAVSIASYPEGAQKVYLVSGLDFADALAAAPLAAAEGAALLLVAKDALADATASELKRLGPTSVVLVGGTAALDAKTESRVKTVLGSKVKVERVGGDTRYETSRLLAARGGNASTVFVATGRGYADALGAAAIAGQTDAPVILVDGAKSSVDAATLTLMKKLKASKVVIVGGTVSVPKGVESQLAAAGLTTARYGGATRYDTNVLLNSAFFPTGAAQAVLASGENFPDALTGSVLAGRSGGPLLVTKGSCMVAATSDYLLASGVAAVPVIGGVDVMSAEVLKVRRC